MKRIISLILVAVLALAVLGGCKNNEVESDSETEPNVLSLTRDTLGKYSIVVSEKADSETRKLASQLNSTIKTTTENDLKIKSDFIADGSDEYCEEEYEILFGYVDREAVREFYIDIRENDNGYAMVEKKILLIGYNAKSLKISLNMFFSDILYGAESKDVLMSNGEQKIVVADYTYDQMTINDVDIKEYKIIYPTVSSQNGKNAALSLQAFIRSKTGYTVTCESDNVQKSEYEIQIGQTNRVTQAMLAARDSSGFDDESYYFSPCENGIWISGNTTYAFNAAINKFSEAFETVGSSAKLTVTSETVYKMSKLQISVLTYNILYNLSESRNADHVLQSLQEQNTDVFGLNEVTDTWISRLTSKFNSSYTCVKGKIRSNDKSAEYCPIFFKTNKFELVESGTKWLSDTPDIMSKYKESHVYRIMSYVILKDKATGVSFMYINAHLENNEEGYDSKAAREKQSKVVKSFADQYANLPIIIGGDMNTTSLIQISPLLSNTRFVNAPTIAKEKNESGTWVGKSFSDITDTVFDYIFVSNDSIAVSKYEAVDNKIDGKYPSDHIPVRIDAIIYQ